MRRSSRIFALCFTVILMAGQGACRAGVVISEFMASNAEGLRDEDGDRADWIEVFNDSASAVDLDGWGLSDDKENPDKWVFPPRMLQAGETLVVFASGKDRRPAAGELHTNFKLAASGEYLGLSDASGAVVHEYAPAFPMQVPDISYGLPNDNAVAYVSPGDACEVGVPVSQSDFSANFSGWKTSAGSFTGSSWQAGAHIGIGYDKPGAAYGSLIGPGGEIGGRLKNIQSTACLRVPFIVGDPAEVATLRLRMKWDDGFIAYINGAEVARAMAPTNPMWNSPSTGNRNEALNGDWTDFEISPGAVPLNAGTNILAIHGFNRTASSSDFLILPVLDGKLNTGTGALPPTWFPLPTPGEANGAGGPIGPSLENPVGTIPRPSGDAASPEAVLAVEVEATVFPVASVTAYRRTMFGAETEIALHDDGVAPDADAADGVFSGIMPTTGPGPGEMLRWRFEALDDHGNAGRAPAFANPVDSDEYFGTVALDPDTGASQLPVLRWFVENPSEANTRGGTRASFFFLGEFYDNVQIDLHGQTTSGFPKKSYDIDFNHGNRFRWKEDERRVKDINLITNYADRTRARNTLAHEMGMRSGTVYHFCFPVRVEQNGGFHGVWDLMEDADDRMLERNGLDPAGAFYKMYNKLTSATSGVQKKTRTDEDHSDLQALIDGLNPSLPLDTRRTFAYDHVDLPATIDYLVTRQLNSDRDHGHKNYFLYRDTEDTGEWRPIIWDVDLSYGHNYGSGHGYFDDVLRWDNALDAGSSQNRLYNLVYESPELRAMFLRRMRTLMDTLLEAPGTVDGMIETRMREIAAQIDPDPANPSAWTDGDRDYEKWGSWGVRYRCREEVERVIDGYLKPRRSFLFDRNPTTRPKLGGDPIPDQPQQSSAGMVAIEAVDFFPNSGTQQEEYIELRNHVSVAVDISGWSLSGAVEHVFEGGTVIPSGSGGAGSGYLGSLIVAKDAAAFRARAAGPRGGQRRLVQGNYHGQLSARGETIELRDAAGVLIDSFSYGGTPTELQQSLRISEICYNPASPSAEELSAMPGVKGADFEFIEFVNIGESAIDLEGARFTKGLDFVFSPVSLEAGARVVLAANPAALALRYGSLPAEVLGPWSGELAGAGERIELVDSFGEVILDFKFKDGWYPATDGPGRSLVARDPVGAPHDSFGEAGAWAISLDEHGSPGAPDPQFAQAYRGWDNFHFTSAERDDPLISGPDADPDGDGRENLFEYAFGGDPRVADHSGVRFTWAEGCAAVSFSRPANAIDLDYELLAGSDLAHWSPVGAIEHQSVPAGGDREQVVLRESTPSDAPARFLKLRAKLR